MVDVGRLDAQEQHAGNGSGAKSETQKALVAGARPKERRAGQRGERGDKPDPVAELMQEDVRRLAIAGVSLGVVVRAEVRRPIDEDRAQEREQSQGAERGRRDRVLPAKARASPQRDRTQLERQHDDDPGGGEGIPAPEHEHRVQGQGERERDAANHGLDARVEALSQREQAGEAFGELERADNQHETADVGHAARGDRHCRGVGDEDGGDAEARAAIVGGASRVRPARRAQSRARIASAKAAGAA